MERIHGDHGRAHSYFLILLYVIFSLIFISLPRLSYANSPGPANYITVLAQNVPESGCFLELLIPISSEDPAYVENNHNAEELWDLSEAAQIVSYQDTEGYVSYSVHMRGAVSVFEEIMSEKYEQVEADADPGRCLVYCFGTGAREGWQSHLEYIQDQFGSVKVAVLDRQGNVLTVSQKVSVASKDGYLAGTLQYSADTGELTAYIMERTHISDIFRMAGAGVLWAVMFFVRFFVRAAFSAVVECLTAVPFKIRAYWKIFRLNLMSNMAFNLWLMAVPSPHAYLDRLIFGELVVAAAEYLIYRRILPEYDKKRLLAFAIVANAASLIGGMMVPIG